MGRSDPPMPCPRARLPARSTPSSPPRYTENETAHRVGWAAGTVPSVRLHLDVTAMLALQRTLELVERRVLDLADALPRQVILVADLAERALLVVAEPEALGQHVGLDRRQVVQQALDLRRQRLRRQ